ncbi:ACT domain-containing protein [Oribacterium sp. oral taxon 102]|uniref:ACT domain-containing protein n=1 Tax=Oribacterium sp. oral taxon 102 TaxID=671214 RepID=UPI0015BA386D|nr:ACT domain-containing protein [Oribacterium sp. oral taxon 102]NWO21529.1 ACT domain-containing protein [Oribacterium sp. oral taxon 102]
MRKAIITVVGKDSVGIIARVCTFLSERNINILDISQTITGGYFNMMMIVDIAEARGEINLLSEALTELGEHIGVSIRIQLEEIFTMMHRI